MSRGLCTGTNLQIQSDIAKNEIAKTQEAENSRQNGAPQSGFRVSELRGVTCETRLPLREPVGAGSKLPDKLAGPCPGTNAYIAETFP